MSTLAEVVSDIMTRERLSSYDVERRSKKRISQTHCVRIANGTVTGPSPDKIRALAAGLGVPPETLFAASDLNTSDRNDLTLTAIADYAAALPAAVREDVLLIVKALHEKHGK